MYSKLMLLVALLAVAVGCNTTGQRVVYRPAGPDKLVLDDRQAVITTATDPQTEQSAQEWARIAADRERQQMDYDLHLREQNARRAQQYAYQTEQRERAKAYNERVKDQQKADLIREGGYALNNVIGQVGQFRSNNGGAGMFHRIPRQR